MIYEYIHTRAEVNMLDRGRRRGLLQSLLKVLEIQFLDFYYWILITYLIIKKFNFFLVFKDVLIKLTKYYCDNFNELVTIGRYIPYIYTANKSIVSSL